MKLRDLTLPEVLSHLEFLEQFEAVTEVDLIFVGKDFKQFLQNIDEQRSLKQFTSADMDRAFQEGATAQRDNALRIINEFKDKIVEDSSSDLARRLLLEAYNRFFDLLKRIENEPDVETIPW